jgi:hypothetical protein
MTENSNQTRTVQNNNRIVKISAIVTVFGSLILFVLWLVTDWTQPYWTKIVEEHFSAIIGLPMAALASFVIVVFLKQTSTEKIEIEGLGFKIKGPSGEVVLWLICFLGITLAIKLLW